MADVSMSVASESIKINIPPTVTLLAVSKGRSADKIRALYATGQTAFGENYLQEALEKQKLLQDCKIEWHFIGHIQSNKTKQIAQHFSWVQSIDRLSVAKRLNDQRGNTLPSLNICIEINIDDEKNKSGICPENLLNFAASITAFKNLKLRGLMIIPQKSTADSFERASLLFKKLHEAGFNIDTLSMGMSADYDAAIKAGSTMVRIGSALFE